MQVGINRFVLRQTAASPFSYYAGTWEELQQLVTRQLAITSGTPGYRDGVQLVSFAPEEGLFFCGVVAVEPTTPLQAIFAARREGETPFLQVRAIGGTKLPARFVDIVLYRHDVLGVDATTQAEWEIISINARPEVTPEPMTPMAMARNMLNLPGGTAATYTAEEFAHAIVYWSTRALLAS